MELQFETVQVCNRQNMCQNIHKLLAVSDSLVRDLSIIAFFVPFILLYAEQK